MPALDLKGQDPCDLLNKTDFPMLWPSEPTAIATFYTNTFKTPGVMKTYVEYLNELKTQGKLAKPILKDLQPSSTVSLIQFLSNGSLAQNGNGTPVEGGRANYSLLSDVVLSIPSENLGIVDSYIVGDKGLKKGNAYSYSTDSDPKLKDTDLWDVSDETADGTISSTPKTVIGCLLRDGFLMTSRELFIPSEFNPQSTYKPPAGQESLIFLYRLGQKGTGNLTPQQQLRKSYLETKNLRFFGAFLAEYCFYRTRYEIMLKQYFTVYSQPRTGNNKYSDFPASQEKLFSTADGTITQPKYLEKLAIQMAMLNTRLTDLRKLLGKISLYYNKVYLEVQKTINSDTATGSNKDLVDRVTALNHSANAAQKYLSDLDFHQGVMQYNAEKNRYSNILLAFYAFLNIAAVAAILQINSS